MTTVNPSNAGVPAGVLPIHVGRGEDAQTRRDAGATGQNLTVQQIQGTEAVSHVPVVAPEVAAAAAAMPLELNIPAEQAVVAPTRQWHEDKTTQIETPVVGSIVAVSLITRQEITYDYELDVDWAEVNPAVMFAFMNADGDIIGSTHKPLLNASGDDFFMPEGQYMKLGNVPIDVMVSFELTLTERKEVKKEPVNELIPVNAPVTVDEANEKPYYHNWGKKRRAKERNRLRSQGKQVPTDL